MTGNDQAVGAGSGAPDGPGSAPEPNGLIGFRRKAFGLVLQPVPAEFGRFRIAVVGAGGEVLLSLGPYAEEDVVAVWRGLAQSSGLPILLDRPDGTLTQPFRQLGRLRLGRGTDRRRLVLLTSRRPRFLARRKSGPTLRRPLVYREREIVAGRGA